MRAPRMRAPLASDCVRSVGLALPSPGIHTAPDRSSVRSIGIDRAGLGGRDEFEVDAEAPGARHLALEQLEPLRRLRDVEAAALLPAGREPGFGFERRIELDAVAAHARRVACRAKLPDQSGGVPGRAAGQLALLEQHDVAAAELGQVIRGARTGDAAADDDDLGMGGNDRSRLAGDCHSRLPRARVWRVFTASALRCRRRRWPRRRRGANRSLP